MVTEVKYGESVFEEEAAINLLRVHAMKLKSNSISEAGDADILQEVDTRQVKHEEACLFEDLHQFFKGETLVILRIVNYLILLLVFNFTSRPLQTFFLCLGHLHVSLVIWDVGMSQLGFVEPIESQEVGDDTRSDNEEYLAIGQSCCLQH